jgi:uncharacterized protein
MKKYFTLLLLLFIYGCQQTADKKEVMDTTEKGKAMHLYSKNVGDTFSISVGLPNGYDAAQPQRYPVVYLLDANVYFDILATTLNKYSNFGLAPEVILVGIGYKDFQMMDSLRCRDDTYPAGLPEDSMIVSGGADKFLAFINNELIPLMDTKYRTDSLRRILMGHSLAGYFTAYALLQDLQGKSKGFSGYIAASPSVNYHKHYLPDRLKGTDAQAGSRKIKAYFSYGGLEDEENKDDPREMKTGDILMRLSALLPGKHTDRLTYKSDIFSNLGHMDAQMPAFIKGLRWVVSDDK